jgi:Leucine-rich repeat (LRR) protein
MVPNFSNLASLRTLELQNNELSGAIPDFSNLMVLTTLNLNDNALSGIIPDFSNLARIVALRLNGNQLSGPISSGFYNSLSDTIRFLTLSDNGCLNTEDAAVESWLNREGPIWADSC